MKLGVLAREREGDGEKKEERDRHTKTERERHRQRWNRGRSISFPCYHFREIGEVPVLLQYFLLGSREKKLRSEELNSLSY